MNLDFSISQDEWDKIQTFLKSEMPKYNGMVTPEFIFVPTPQGMILDVQCGLTILNVRCYNGACGNNARNESNDNEVNGTREAGPTTET